MVRPCESAKRVSSAVVWVPERAGALASSPIIGLGDLPATVSGLAAASAVDMGTLPEEGCKLDEVLGELERRLMLQALERTGVVKKRAAKLLGVTFRSLRYRLAKYGLDDDSDEDEPITGDIEVPLRGLGGAGVPKNVTSGPPWVTRIVTRNVPPEPAPAKMRECSKNASLARGLQSPSA